MQKKVFLFLIVLVIGAVSAFSVFAASNWHCCTTPSCTECDHDMLGCNCALREKLGMQVCGECASQGCGMHNSEEVACHYEGK